MGTIIKIISFIAALAVLGRTLGNYNEYLKRLNKPLNVLIGLCVLASAGLNFWPSDNPATKSDVEKVGDQVENPQAEHKLDMENLMTYVMTLAGQEEPDSSLIATIRVLAERLEGIVETAFDKGIVAIGLEKYDDALTHLDYALKAAGENLFQRASVFFYIGYINSRQGNNELALVCYDSSVTYDSFSRNAWYNRGNTLTKLDRYEEAIASYDSALVYDLTYYKAWYNRGFAYTKLSRPNEAIANYDRALAYKHDIVEAWYNRGIDLIKLNQYGEAIASFDSTLIFNSNHYNAWHYRGNALIELNRDEEAIASFDSALVYKSDLLEAWYKRGYALTELNRHGEAIAGYDSALSYQPDSYRAWKYRAISLTLLNRFEEALSNCDSALYYSPGDSAILALRNEIMDFMNK
ncbi:MAG: tetratricopeptide repeat protein [Candidatus Zixiibacteriota bacterium]